MRAIFAVPSAASSSSSDDCNWLCDESYPSVPSFRCKSMICSCVCSTSAFSSSNCPESHCETRRVDSTGVW